MRWYWWRIVSVIAIILFFFGTHGFPSAFDADAISHWLRETGGATFILGVSIGMYFIFEWWAKRDAAAEREAEIPHKS